eukprot:CAMPEP_0196578912 /NCGR_PEP_ID=MMETSP1081-20130531/12578_1 /TAXON_ID=36882 /ORGANISM="Pyramimonas amylifera, Strain CCMP720" /LENGTH=292 /DNA_ID=CAMNT_0041898301 /DNA_START=82 /DNA_END=957 /DNA_ORIENTATION=-
MYGGYEDQGYGGNEQNNGQEQKLSASKRFDTTSTEGKLFLGGLSSHTTKETLEDHCSPWGDIKDAVVMEGRGFGFVTFTSEDSADRFLAQKGGHTINGRVIDVKKAVPKPSGGGGGAVGGRSERSFRGGGGRPEDSLKLFIGGTQGTEENVFREYFEQFGTMSDCVLLRNAEGKSRGFGFVTYTDSDAVEKVVRMSHTIGDNVTVEVKRAVPREDQRGMGRGGFAGPVDYGGQQIQAGVKARPGDWECLSCGNMNFTFREKCNRCDTARGSGGQGGGYGMGGGGGGMGGGMG